MSDSKIPKIEMKTDMEGNKIKKPRTWGRPAATVGEEAAPETISDDDVIASLSEADLRERSAALNEAQENWEEVASTANPKIPCPECGTAGNVSGGSLGDICPRCLGSRVLDAPGRTIVQQPDFRGMRAAITAYGDALADRLLPSGHRAKKQLALPAAATVPSLESIATLNQQAIDVSRQLAGAKPAIESLQLQDPRKPSEDGNLGDVTDADLDDIEIEDDSAPGRRAARERSRRDD